MIFTGSAYLRIKNVVSVFRVDLQPGIRESLPRTYPTFCWKLSGSSVHISGNDVARLNAGSLLFLPADYAYRVNAEIAGPSIGVEAEFTGDSDFKKQFALFTPTEPTLFEQKFLRMLELYTNGHPGNDLRLIGELNLLLAETDADQLPATPRGALYSKLQPALDCISAHISDRIPDEKALAARCGYSTGYFRRLFREYTGMTLTSYIQEKKIGQAAFMLRSRMFSIAETAAQLGFSDVFYFNTVFKRVTGVSPGRYMKSQRS